MHRAVFVDRDGVICRNRSDHVKRWEEFVFLPGALEALEQANIQGAAAQALHELAQMLLTREK